MMLPYKYAVLAVFLIGQFNPSFQQINWTSLISNAAGVNDVVTLAISAVDFISGKQSAEDELHNDIKESISNAKTEVLEGILIKSTTLLEAYIVHLLILKLISTHLLMN